MTETIVITSLGNEAEGIGALESKKKVFVKGALPGEEIVVKYEENSKRFIRGELVEILKESPDRIEPVCKYYGQCGGCNMMHMSHEVSLNYKRKKVVDCLTRIGKFDYDEIDKITADTVDAEIKNYTHYRNHVQYKIVTSRCGNEIGFVSDDYIIDVDDCVIEYEIFGKVRNYIRQRFNDAPSGIFCGLILRGSEVTHEIVIEFVALSNGRHEVLIRDAKLLIESMNLDEFVNKSGYKLKGVVLQICPDNSSFKRRAGKRIVLSGEAAFCDILSGHKFKINSGSFFQVNTLQAEKLYLIVKEFMDDSKVVYDLYCGTGSIGLTVVSKEQKLLGIEVVSEAVTAAKENARLNEIDNAKFICKPCEKVNFDELDFPLPDTVIVDPPRKGMDFLFIKQLFKLSPSQIIYVSCDPATLARDLAMLKSDYKLVRVVPVDMFNFSSHVETVCLLSRKS